ncbi:MFS transporter [Actinokineospora sp. HUAS TT18]|uniref:MFS transporter n=1 Tax=Actinokineospora sp. HUAS TT18 TaxID=3447451 RepID=UPI003F51F5F8
MFAVLANREFRALWFTEAVSVAGDQLTRVALAILVFTRTGSALWSAGIYALTFLPALAGGLGLSHFADRYRRRTLMVVCAAAQAVLVGLMAIPNMPLWVLFILVIGVPLIQAPAVAAQNATTREIFEEDNLYFRSQELRGVTTNTMLLLGLGGGGLLVAWIGTSWALAIDAATFALAALVVRRWVGNRPPAGSKKDHWLSGARFVFGDRRLRILITLSWLVGLAVIPEGLAAPLAAEIGAPDRAVGLLLAADPLGFIIGTFLISRFVPVSARPRVIGVLATASVAVLTLFVLHPNLIFALLLLFLAGGVGAYQITVMSLFNTIVPNEIRGGAFGAARTGLRVAQGLGVALGGAVAQLIGSSANTIALAGALGVVIAIPATIAWSRAQKAVEAESPAAPKPRTGVPAPQTT